MWIYCASLDFYCTFHSGKHRHGNKSYLWLFLSFSVNWSISYQVRLLKHVTIRFFFWVLEAVERLRCVPFLYVILLGDLVGGWLLMFMCFFPLVWLGVGASFERTTGRVSRHDFRGMTFISMHWLRFLLSNRVLLSWRRSVFCHD